MADEMEFAIDDDEILDYDDGDDLGFSTDGDEEDVESVVEPEFHPQTPEEKIMWQEQIRMIHLRSHLNQLAEKVKHANYVVDKTREELKKCRAHMHHLESERDSNFQQIQTLESEGNQSSVYRLRATHGKLCEALEEEQKLECKILERLELAEYELAVVEVERGKFILAEDDLLRQEHQLAKDKTSAALLRLQKEKSTANQARRTKIKDARHIAETMKEQAIRHQQALEDADRSHERANKYLQKTMEKMKLRQQKAEETHKVEMQRKMDMLVKLKADITTNRDLMKIENLKAVRARDKAEDLTEKELEDRERQKIIAMGGNPDQEMIVKKRTSAQEQKRQQFEREQTQRKIQIMSKILSEEKHEKKKKKQQPYLWNEPKWEKTLLRMPPHEPKPLQTLQNYIRETTGAVEKLYFTPNKAITLDTGVQEKGDEEKEYMEGTCSSSDNDEDLMEPEVEDLAKPEFEGLWEQHKPYRVPKDLAEVGMKPVGGSKMDREILQKTLEQHRSGIIVKQVAAGKEFSGCPFYSKPDVIHFKDFDVGSSYKKRVVLTNVSYSINYCKFIDITERLKDFIKIEFNPPGQMSAGMACEMLVTFKPMINEDLFGQVNFLSQTGPFSIPLQCTTKKCDLVLDVNMIDFGTMVIGETVKRSFTLTNRGALGCKYDFFKVTGMKQRTLTTAGTSLGRMTNDSMRGVSPDSEPGLEPKPTEKPKPGAGSTAEKGSDSKKRSQEDLEKIPEAGEQGLELQQGEGSEGTDIVMPTGDGAADGLGGSDPKGDQEVGDAISPDLAVSEVEEYNLDGMRVGSLVTGEIGPKSEIRLDIVWQPSIPGKIESEFLVTFADPLSEGLSVRTKAHAIDVPVWVERQTIDLKICMFDRLYQDTVVVNNRATTALRLKFEVCKELRNHLEILPKTGYIQAQSQFSAQLKFLPRKSLFEEAERYFDRDTGVLEAPMIITVADQQKTAPVPFTVNAVVTTSDLEFDVKDIDFGCCTVYESVRSVIKLTNKSILPQQFGFLGLPEFPEKYAEVQPNDGFGTLLPLETIELDVIFSPAKANDYKFELVCKSLINRDFRIACVGVGVLPPLHLSHQVIHFAATALYDVSVATVHVLNDHTSSNEFTHPVPRMGSKGEICPVGPTSFEFKLPDNVPLTISPAVGTIEPGKKTRVQLRFSPKLEDEEIRHEAVRMACRMEAAKAEKEYAEALKQEREASEMALKQAAKTAKQQKGNQGSPGRGAPKGGKPLGGSESNITKRVFTPPDPSTITADAPAYKAAIGSLMRQFKGMFGTVVIPCYVASGATGNPGELPYSIHNTLYLEVHCPVVKPEIVVISDNGSSTVNFGEVSIGQVTSRSITLQNISDKTVELKSSALNTLGPFLMVNALRVLAPNATHTLIVSFTPTEGRIFQESLEIKTATSVLHLTLAGRGVSPMVTLSVEGKVFDVGAVLEKEYSEKPFKIENTSSLAIDYVIKLDSQSLRRHEKAQILPRYLRPESTIKHFVGVQNLNGQSVFDFVPSEGTIPAGEAKEILITFAPDHESLHYSDGVRIELFGQDESHFFQVKGQALAHIMYMEGGDPLYPDVESLSVSPNPISLEEEEDNSKPKKKRKDDSKGGPVKPMLVTLKSHTKDEAYLPATRDVYACCVRTMAISQKKETKKNGEYQFENVTAIQQKGFSIEPQKGMVEAGAKKPITITWTPPTGFESTQALEETVVVTLRGDVTEQYELMLRAIVVSE